ncbi:MAG: response regulator [Candidatus Margulisbacteria bacterium]|nr:response regulator [Candidatus Margulisiibacteriota bacterium]
MPHATLVSFDTPKKILTCDVLETELLIICDIDAYRSQEGQDALANLSSNWTLVTVGRTSQMVVLVEGLKKGVFDYWNRPLSTALITFFMKRFFAHLSIRDKTQALSRKPRLLIVEDEEDSQQLLAAFLGGDFDISIAGTCEDAARYFSEDIIDLVLMDVCLPDKSGLEFLAQIQPTHPECVVIIMTAYSDSDVLDKIFASTAFDFLPKPFLSLDLKSTLSHASRYTLLR